MEKTTVALVLFFVLQVQCANYHISDVRLQRGDYPREGNAEIELAKGVWKTVCLPSDVEGRHLARVICRHLGFDGVPNIINQPPNNATRIYRLPSALNCASDGTLENCTARPYIGTCQKLLDVRCDSEPMSCTGRCGQPSNAYSCGCDVKCSTFGDCCYDTSDRCPREWATGPSNGLNDTSKRLFYKTYGVCVNVSREDDIAAATMSRPTRFKMVSKCPISWPNERVKNHCESASSDDRSDLLHMLPVHNQGGVLFKNSFCAMCHGTAVEEMLLWQVESLDSMRQVSPPRNIWGSQYEICDENLEFVKGCPPGTNVSISDKCERFVKSEVSVDRGVKNDHCKECNNITRVTRVSGIKYPVTFDVLFGIKSWATMTETCRSDGNVNVEKLFQNACPLLEELLILEGTSSQRRNLSREDCAIDFVSRIFQSTELFRQLGIVISSGANDGDATKVVLPNLLSALHLETTVVSKVAVPECDLKMEVAISNTYHCNQTSPTRRTKDVDVGDEPSNNTVFEVECNHTTCEIIHLLQIDCGQLSCRWEDEYLSPIDFKIDDFAAMEMTHIRTGASLTDRDFVVTQSGDIHTCSEALIGPWTRAAYFIQITCGPLSLVCIILMVAIHAVFPKLRNIYGFCIVSLLCMLFLSLSFFMVTTVSQTVDGLAQVVVALSHYAWLSAFSWMAVISFHVSHTFGSKFVANRMSRISNRRESLLYSLVGWGLPLPFLTTGVFLHGCGCTEFHYTRHWMSRGLPTFMLFVFPAGLLAVTTTILFVCGIAKLRRRQATPPSGHSRFSMTHNYLVALRLFFIVGIPWVLFIVYVASRSRILLPVLTLVNSLQGCFIFLSFVTTKRVRGLLGERLLGHRPATTATFSRGKQTGHTEASTPENTPRLHRWKISGSSPPNDRRSEVN